MIKHLFLTGFIGLFTLSNILAQSSLIPLNSNYYHLLDRYEIKTGQLATTFDTNVKSYARQAVGQWLDSLTLQTPSPVDQFNLQYLAQDHWEYMPLEKAPESKPILKYFYKHRRDALGVQEDAFQLSVNPVFHFQVGKEETQTTYINTRGVQVFGMIDQKVGFYSYIGENQIIFPSFVQDYVRQTLTVPQEGFWKGYGSRGVDFISAQGHFSVKATRHIGVQFGHGKHFVGNGYRSLVLSDFANNYLYLRLNTQVWKLHYTNIFARMTADVIGNSTGLYGTVPFPAKYVAFHRLGINLSRRLQLGVYESIVFGDSTGRFDANYLNPIIFYRAIEQQNGSMGNALLGLDMKWLLLDRVSLYGQALIDEFVISEMKSGQGWWGNKYALQLGMKYIDAFSIPNLDLQLEINRVRPYTYAHEDLFRSYSHYEQPLAHPLGANFREKIAIVRYQPIGRLQLQAKWMSATYGADTASSNWGNNILLDNRTREQDYGNALEQGIKTTLQIADLSASYQLWHNGFLDLRYLYRRKHPASGEADALTQFTSVGLRLNIAQRNYDF